MKLTTMNTRSEIKKSKIQTRAMVVNSQKKELIGNKPETSTVRKASAALLEAKRKAKAKMLSKSNEDKGQQEDDKTNLIEVKDIFQKAMDSKNKTRGETGIIYDENMSKHKCLWDDNHPERPERFIRVLQRCNELKLVQRCKRIPSRLATKNEILLKHSEDHYDLLKSICDKQNEVELESTSSKYDSIYFHPTTFELSLLASGSTIDLIDNICNNKIQNGMAIIRPPGHHAMKAEYNGYCFFNNVAIGAQYALDKLNLKKILIIDYDVHHGQGTQRFFYNDPRVLYFSIHRYEYGTFWPNLRESDFDYIGEGSGKGYNFNLPLNAPGMKNADYMAIFQQILVPVAIEFQPELIIVSAGYDAALGCPEGEMEVTPGFYPHLLNPILCLAESKVAVILEGGYCLESLAEGAALTLRSLLSDPCPQMQNGLQAPCELVQDAILNCIYSHRPYWKCLQLQKTYTQEELNNYNPQPTLHKVVQQFKHDQPTPVTFPTRGCYPIQDPLFIRSVESKLRQLKLSTKLTFPQNRTCYVYDDFMMEHRNTFEEWHPEHPNRIKKINEKHIEYGLLERMEKLKSRLATSDEICLAHTRAHFNLIRRSVENDELREIGAKYNSVYFHPKTFECALMAAGSLLQIVDSVLNNTSRSGIAIIRPPGHHAESDLPHGFCIFNNVAVAAQYAVKCHGLQRVLIIDWDVHHGNGTQHIFESNPKVLYISVHRYDNGTFFPKSTDANYNVVGEGAGTGFNVNIPWNKKGMGDPEYSMAFQQVIMPIAYEFNPELVLISAGFDAAVGDPLGGCKVTPEAYGYFTHWLTGLANGKIIVCLEGGYNVNSISYAMTMCTKSLLGDPLPMLQINSNKTAAYQSCVETLQNVLTAQEKYWKSLKFNKKLPKQRNASDELIENFSDMKIKTVPNSDEKKEKNASQNDEFAEGAVGGSQAGSTAGNNEGGNQNLTDFIIDNLQALQNEEMFFVIPKKKCPHLSQLKPEEAPQTIDTRAVCGICSSTKENWICLICFQVFCGRYVQEHMLEHYSESEHPLALSLCDLSVWCYVCESYIDNQILYKYKNMAHQNKFNTELAWTYGPNTNEATLQSNIN